MRQGITECKKREYKKRAEDMEEMLRERKEMSVQRNKRR